MLVGNSGCLKVLKGRQGVQNINFIRIKVVNTCIK
jgi:hypothetical protein